MKLSEVLIESPQGVERRGDEKNWQEDPSGQGKKAYWVKGKNKEGKDRRYGPFQSSSDAQKFKSTRTDIRNPQIVFE
jgi:hypothetical protein